jgi:hypothetical protein
LWKTLQDRLTKELRLSGSATLAEANAFLPVFIQRYNRRFAKAAQDPNPAWVPLPKDLDFPYYFAVRDTRKVRADHCISFFGQILQLQPSPKDPSLVDRGITVHVVPEGDIYVYHGKRRIGHQAVAARQTPPPQPTPEAQRPAQPADLKAKAKQRAWLFGQH